MEGYIQVLSVKYSLSKKHGNIIWGFTGTTRTNRSLQTDDKKYNSSETTKAISVKIYF